MNIQPVSALSDLPSIQKTSTNAFLTETKVKKVALTVFGVLFTLGACGTLSATLAGVLPIPAALLSIPLLCFAHRAFMMESQMKDYGDPYALQQMQEAARWMSFSKLREEHGGLTHLLLHKVMTPLELRYKFLSEQENRPLSELIKEFPIAYIKKYGLASSLQLREKLYYELIETVELKTLYENCKHFETWELEHSKVISEEESRNLRAILDEIKKLEEDKKKNLMKIHTEYFARRENILLDLERRELEGVDLKAVLDEKDRLLQEETLGKSLQLEYEEAKKEIEKSYIKGKSQIKKQIMNLLEFECTLL